jgi:hypothetical protein
MNEFDEPTIEHARCVQRVKEIVDPVRALHMIYRTRTGRSRWFTR